MSFAPINIKEEGYMFVYLSYENESNNWVYFDDMKVTHTKSNVIQYNACLPKLQRRQEYYPFGLQASTSWTRENTYGNAYLYNEGSELNNTTGWYEMFYRGYDPALGRMFQVDPFASLYSSHSVFNYAINSPAQLNDPDGGRVAHPGKGHWSDGIGQPFWTLNGSQGDNHNGGYGGSGYSSAQKRDYFLMRASAFENKYGIHPGRIGFENGQMKVKVWNPVGGELAYSNSYEKDGKTYIDNYYYGAWQLQQQTQKCPPGTPCDDGPWIRNSNGYNPQGQNNSDGLSNSFIAGGAFDFLTEAGKVAHKEINRQVLINNSLRKPGTSLDAPFKVSTGVKYVAKYGGTAFSLWGAYEINGQWSSGRLTTTGMVIEQIVNGLGVIPGYGTALSLGWDGGKLWGPSKWYGSDNTKWFK